MLLHYPQQYDHHSLPIHYQSYDKPSNLHLRELPFTPSRQTSLPQRPLQPTESSMPTPQQTSNPAVRIHQSIPSPSHKQQSDDSQSMLAQGAFLGSGWNNEGFPGAAYLDTLPRKTGRYHKRLSSGSSATSVGPPSPRGPTSPYCQIANSDSSHFSPLENFDCMPTPQQNHLSKPLPTPAETPTSTTFMPPGYQNAAASQDNHRFSSSAMRRMQSAPGEDDGVSYAYAGPQSVSSMSHNSPATPHTNYETEYDDKTFARGEKIQADIDKWMDDYLLFDPGYPQAAAFSQNMQDVFPDQSYNTSPSQNFSQQSQPNMPHTSSHLSPYRNMTMFANRLQAANQDHMAQRTSSPVTSIARERSPFKPYNNMQELSGDASPHNPMTMMTQTMMSQSQAPAGSKSVSPKVLMLDDPVTEDADATPLFPEQFDQSSIFAGRGQNSNMARFRDQNGMYNGQSFPTAPAQVPQQYPFVSGRRRQQSSAHNESEPIPEFPAHMVSMETTVEEGPSEPSSSQNSSHQQQQQQHNAQPIQRPSDTSADSGTYTCTYHGCSLRFETPAKLQKHKREAHRQSSPTSGPASAPAGPTNLGLRNSQAGPHKCQRINPSTGKPCNSIFSRPYDLTRHEDTIHNARKQKVRCHLCTEEKTFSRNDALTRHMRVVHPDVDWPGKTRRGKGRD